MIAGVADTRTALWYLLKDPSLSLTARRLIDDGAEAGQDIVVSPISLAEIVYLVEKNRLPASAYEDLKNALVVLLGSKRRQNLFALALPVCTAGS